MVRAQLAEAGKLNFSSGLLAADSEPFSVRIARMYKHLGSKITVDRQPIDEVRARAGLIYGNMRKLRRRVLKTLAYSCR